MEFVVRPVGQLRANAYVLFQPEREDALVIDPGGEPEVIKAAAGGRRLAGIVLTHGHFDHMDAVSALRGPDVPVYIHEKDAGMLTDPERSYARGNGGVENHGAPDVLLKDGERLEIAGVPLDVIHTPGHTPGSICLLNGEDLFSGDTLFREAYGRLDLAGGSLEAMRKSLQRLFALDGSLKVHPGHGDSTTIAEERRRYSL